LDLGGGLDALVLEVGVRIDALMDEGWFTFWFGCWMRMKPARKAS